MCIDITNDCNMDCPWCIGEHEHGRGVWSEDTRQKFYAHVSNYEYSRFSLHGGESLLYPGEMFDVLTRLRIMRPTAALKLFTNATLLTEQIAVDLNNLGVKVCVSMQAEGPKGLMNLMRRAAEPSRLIGSIKRLKRCAVRTVILRGADFADEALLLHGIFGQPVEAFPDYTTLDELTLEDVAAFDRELRSIAARDHDYGHWFSLGCRFTDSFCDCPSLTRHFFADGSIGWNDYTADYGIYGCAMFQKMMKPEVYKAYTELKEMK